MANDLTAAVAGESMARALQTRWLIDAAQMCQIGGRDSNQDALDSLHNEGLHCFLVADGAGGHKGGEIAAAVAIKAISTAFAADSAFSVEKLSAYLNAASQSVARAQDSDQQLREMSTTVVSLLIDTQRGAALWAHLGDSRIYFFPAAKNSSDESGSQLGAAIYRCRLLRCRAIAHPSASTCVDCRDWCRNRLHPLHQHDARAGGRRCVPALQ
ncbi:PP2C family protein-serine/threonine phosphatase [Undibacterium arcticum]